MKRTKVKSSSIKSVGHSGNSLEVEFNSGDVYVYKGVPKSVASELMKASSVGAFFAKAVRNNYTASKQS